MSSTDPTTIGVHRALHEALIAAREAQHRLDNGDATPDLDDLVELATLLAGLSESVTAVNSGMIAKARPAGSSATSASTRRRASPSSVASGRIPALTTRRSRDGGRRGTDADHRVTGHEAGQFGLAECVGPGRAHGQHPVAHFRAGVPDPYLDRVGQLVTEVLAQHLAGLLDDPRAVSRLLVPVRRQAEYRPRVTRAQRADDHVMYVGGVLHDDHVLALQAADAEVSAGLRGVGEQSLLECGIGPGPGHHLRAQLGADLVLVDLHEPVDRRGRHDALLYQDRLERLDPRGDLFLAADVRAHAAAPVV